MKNDHLSDYIMPAIELFDSLSDTFEPNPFTRGLLNFDRMQTLEFKDINALKCAFIIGESGYGKSLLISQLQNDAGRELSLRIDCRKFAGEKEKIDFAPFTHIFFDGLDEVPPLQFLNSLNRIKGFVQNEPGKSFFIACRSHYIKRFFRYVEEFGKAKFVQLQPFQEQHIRQYLDWHELSQEIVNAIVYKAAVPGGRSVLSTPRYLAALVNSIQQDEITPEEIKAMRRVDIFEKVIYYQLRTEIEQREQQLNNAIDAGGAIGTLLRQFTLGGHGAVRANELHLTQRVLEKLAFIMEIYQRNIISKAELITFLDEAHSNINLIFLNYNDIDVFIERTLKTVDEDNLQFENTEFQEYLAAKELVRMSDREQVLYDLILQQDLQVIYSNWLDVLQYAIELDADKVAGSLARYLKENRSRQSDERLIQILMGPGAEATAPEVKAALFDALFCYFQESGLYIYQKNDDLARLFVPERNLAFLSISPVAAYNQDNIRQLVNQVLIVRSLAESGNLPVAERQAWKDELLRILTIAELKEHYQVWLWALEVLDAKAELIGLSAQVLQGGDNQVSSYLESMGRIAADEMVDFFENVIRKRPHVIGKEDFLDDLQTVGAISRIFALLIAEPPLLASVFNNDTRFASFYRLFDVIRQHNDDHLKKVIQDLFFVITSGRAYSTYQSNVKAFIDRALQYLLQNVVGFSDDLLASAHVEEILRTSAESIAAYMTLEQFVKFYAAFSANAWRMHLLQRLISQLNILGGQDRQQLLDTLKKNYPEFFVHTVESDADAKEREEKETKRLYKEFEDKLMRGQDRYHRDLFAFYLNHRERLKNLIAQEDIEYIKEQVRNLINGIVPENYKVTLTRSGNSLHFDLSNVCWFRFGHFVDVAFKLGLEDVLKANRLKLIKYMPLMNEYLINEESKVNQILEFLGPISPEETAELLQFLTNRGDDYIFSSVASFTKLISTYKLISFKPILQDMLAATITDQNEKEAAMKAYGELSSTAADRAYLEGFAQNYDPTDAVSKTLAELANAILIESFDDPNAIRWRFAEVLKREKVLPNAFSHSGGMRPYSAVEQEMDRPTFLKCLDKKRSDEVRQQFELLLRHSLQSRRKPGYSRYSDYIQLMVYQYFSGQIDLKWLNRLRGLLAENTFADTAGSFKRHMRNLEIHYMNSYQFYQTISESVKRYNELKAKAYLPVAYEADLAAVVDLAIEDLRDFVDNKGYYQTAQQLSGVLQSKKTKLFNEDILQKTFRITLENSLLKRGLRNSDIHREIELFDGKRLDLWVKYGFIGPIMLELKLLHNPEITDTAKRAAYKIKMKQYIKACEAEYAYYVVFNIKKNNPAHNTAFKALEKEYADIPNLKIVLIECPIK